MFIDSLCSAVTGVIFGAALTASRVHLPTVVINQFLLADFHMLHVFAAAVGSSAAIMLALERLHIVDRPVRRNTSLGWASAYDGNVIGGIMLGIGMALSGACPGTVIVQLAQDIEPAKSTAVGAILGAIAYVRFSQINEKCHPQQLVVSKSTISEVSRVPEAVTYLTFDAMIWGIVSLTPASAESSTVSPVTGGLMIGLAQAASLIFNSTPLGVSTAYEQMGRYFLRALGNESVGKPSWPPKSIIFALGIFAGSTLLSSQRSVPETTELNPNISHWQAGIGGFIMAFGARLGGGCTSGHGLSGLSAMSYSSLLTVASMFAAGIVTRHVISAFAV